MFTRPRLTPPPPPKSPPCPAAVKEASEGAAASLTSCIVTTPKYEVKISQIWGWDRAAIDPVLEGWTAPYTWLQADFHMLQQLKQPVTGILGRTYPKDAGEEANLEGLAAEIMGDTAQHGRSLHHVAATMPVFASLLG